MKCLGCRFIELEHLRVFELAGRRVKVLPRRDPTRRNADQRGAKSLPLCGAQVSLEIEIRRVAKRHPFAFSLNDQSDCDALDPTGREPRPDFFPQKWRNIVTVKTIENPASFLGLDQALVDLARREQCPLDRFLGDLVEHHPTDRNFRLENLLEMPRDGLSLAVLVRREIKCTGVFESRFEKIDMFLFVRRNYVNRLEILLDVDSKVRPRERFELRGHLFRAARQVPNMADRSLYLEVTSKEFRNRLGFGRRLDDDQGLL